MEKDITNEIALKNSIFRIGSVYSVDGREIRIKVDKRKNASHLLFRGELIKNVSVGSYLKIAKGYISIIGKVEGEHISEDFKTNTKYNKEENKIDLSDENYPFNKTLEDWIGYKIDKRTKFDLTISSGLALLGAQKTKKEKPKADFNEKQFFRTFKPKTWHL